MHWHSGRLKFGIWQLTVNPRSNKDQLKAIVKVDSWVQSGINLVAQNENKSMSFCSMPLAQIGTLLLWALENHKNNKMEEQWRYMYIDHKEGFGAPPH